MDRRQKKTRTAIFQAFITLLSEKSYHEITVEQLIQRADVGRATFYAHFETKEFLLKALCQELFDHIFAAAQGQETSQLFHCNAPDSVYLHLFRHLQDNDNNILKLLTCRNNELFWGYFQEGLKLLAKDQLQLFSERRPPELPEDFWISHIVATFIQTLRWWLETGRQQSPEQITRYFLLAV